MHHVLTNNLEKILQHCISKHDLSVVNTLLHDWELVGTVLLDFTAAFGVIDHSIVIGKLKCCGFHLKLMLG